MTGEEKFPKITVRYNGLFDFDGLYVAVSDWAKNYGYMWHEAGYKHKIPSPKGAEQELKWQITKKVTEYIFYEINMVVHAWELSEVEVNNNGVKKTLSNARIYITIDGKLTYDWQKRFAGSRFAQKLGEWYEKMVRPVETVYWDQMYYRMWNLQALIKKYFDMQTKKYAYKGYLGEDR